MSPASRAQAFKLALANLITQTRNSSFLSASRAPRYNTVANALRARAQDSPGSQSLTFGFAFMAILVFLIFFAHTMQRWANRRQRELLDRMAELREAQEVEEVPRIWDVHLRRGRCGGDRWRWSDMQPLAAHVISTEAAKQTPAEPRDRPLRVAMIISMPVSPSSGVWREKSMDEPDPNRHAYYELGVMKVK